MASSNYNNQGKSNCNGGDLRRSHELQMSSQLVDSGNQNVANLLLPSSQGTPTNPLLSYQSTSFSGLYASPGFNSSLSGYENNLQWLTDNRIQNQHNQLPGSLITDKSINTTTHPPTTSHSCCVNRFGMLDSLGMGSPLPSEQGKSCDVPSFQNKSNLTMNMIDPIQSWFNLQIPTQISNNQQYCKYGERSTIQNYNIPVSMPSQINLPLIDQTDLKQNDMCMQSPDTCFESVNTTSNKHSSIDNNVSSLKQNTFSENKEGMIQENGNMLKQQSSYQASLISKDWKSTIQTMQNYIPSPNMFSAVNEPQENYLFAQYNIPPANSYYPPSDNYSNFINKNTACMSQTKNIHGRNENNPVHNSFINQNNSKLYNNQIQNNINSHYHSKPIKESGKTQPPPKLQGNNSISINYNGPLSDCCQMKKSAGKSLNLVDNNNRFVLTDNGKENKTVGNKNVTPLDPENQSDKRGFKGSEAASSESDESNIIVEESDDIGEIESEISIEDIKKSYQANETCANEVLLRCLVCNTATSSNTPANQFIHMNDSFPLTTSSRTPVRTKLEQILPLDLQHYLKIHNSFMCRRCLNLIETVEILELKLTTAKKTISDTFFKTVQELVPVEQLLQDDNKSSKKPLPEEVDTIGKALVDIEITVENENKDDDKEIINSDTEPLNEFQCSYCSKILSSQINFNLHLQQHTKEFRYYCERCGKGFPLKSSLEKHLHWHNGDVQDVKMLCEVCGDVFTSKHHFNTHQIKIHLRSSNFTCETCGKGFTRKVSLEIHSHKHNGIRPFICEYCGHTFSSEGNLKCHIKCCTKDLPHKCDVCGKSYVLESQLTRHKSQHSGVYKLTCSVCGKGFSKPSDLKYHMVSHSSNKAFKCSNCDKSFKTLGNLNYHSKVVHKEEKIFNCRICGRGFSQQNHLSDHMNSHQNERPYKCKQCEKSFGHQTTFITHLKTHTGKVKMKMCQVCGKSIKTRMSVHMRSHTGERPYKCTYCPLAFTVGMSLKKHIDAKHCKT